MTQSGRPRRIMVSCGEASGDLYAGALLRALREQTEVDAFGFAGAQFQQAGGELVGDYRGFSVTGLTEALGVVRRSYAMLNTLVDAARTRKPDVFIAIDFPDFNFRLLPKIKALGIPVVYYISPQLWAWRPGRLKTIQQYVDRVLVIFPFEEKIYRDANVPVTFVGHPLVDLAHATRSRTETCAAAGLDPGRQIVALLPGSRPNELRLLLPVLAMAAQRLHSSLPDVQFLVARAPALDDELFAPIEDARRRGVTIGMLENAADDVLATADVAATASGTATIQTALHRTPLVIVYRVSGLTYAIARRFVKLTTYGMVNLVAERPVVKELIQDDCTAEAVAAELLRLLSTPAAASRMKDDLDDVVRRLGGSGGSARAAAAVLETIGG
ncbi:MAG: lipid-A-disaccharide synthase [Acidimicrobiia bacterium]